MSAIFLPRKWRHQPQGAVQVDPRWADRLRIAVLPSLGLGNLASSGPAISEQNGTPAIGVSTGGIVYDGVAQARYGPVSASGGLTIVSVWRASVAKQYSSFDTKYLFSTRSSSNKGWSCGRAGAIGGGSNGTKTRQVFVLQGIAQYDEVNYTIESLVDTPVAIRYDADAGLVSWFRFGEKSSPDTSASKSPSDGDPVIFGGHGPWSGVSSWIDRAYIGLVFDGALSDDEIAELTADASAPYQIFRAPSHRIWFDVGAASAAQFAGGAQVSVDATGALTTSIRLAGASIVATTSTGSLSTGIQMQADAASVTLASGALTANIRLRADALSSAIAAAGLTTAIRIAADAQAGASATGDLTTTPAGAELAGNANAAALAAGSLTAHIRLAADSVARAIASGVLSTGISMQGAASIAALASGVVTTQVRLAAQAVAGALASGDLSGAAALAGSALGSALATGDLATAIRLSAAALASGDATGALSTTPAGLAARATALVLAAAGLTTAIQMQGAAVSYTQATGTLDIALTMRADAFVTAMASGVLSTQVRMDGAAVASALARADLTGGMPVVPPAARTIPVRAQNRVIPVRAQTRLIPA